MPSVTVAGAHGTSVTLEFDSNANALLARSLADAITAGVTSGSILPATSSDGPPPTVPGGRIGEWVQEDNGTTLLGSGYKAIVSTADNARILGSGERDVTVLGSAGNLTFLSGGGSGTVVTGGGDNRIVIPAGGKAADAWLIATGDGNDRIQALGNGNDTVRAGGGRNTIELGGGKDVVVAGGDDRIVMGGGSATIIAEGSGWTQVYGGAGKLLFVGGDGPATVFGGSGSSTILGGSGDGEYYGGSGGRNVIYAGTGEATVYGGGAGDRLYAEGDEDQTLIASDGATTLFGALAGGDNTFQAGGGKALVVGGFGDDTFVDGGGSSTIVGGPGADVYSFVRGLAGGEDLVFGFGRDDRISLAGYGRGEIARALASQERTAAGTEITLSDHTTITFVSVARLTASDFVLGDAGDHGHGHGHGHGGDDDWWKRGFPGFSDGRGHSDGG